MNTLPPTAGPASLPPPPRRRRVASATHIAFAMVAVAMAGMIAWSVAHPRPVLAEEILGKPGTLRIIGTTYPSDSVVVAKYVVTQDPYGADPTGAADATAAFQRAMNDAAKDGGGTVFVPEGRYSLPIHS